jgi:hypothetical protein
MANDNEKIFINQQLTTGIQNSAINKMWRIFAVSQNSVLELRALWPTGITPSKRPITQHFRVSDYPKPDACKATFEAEALRLNALGYNIYTVMNPIRSDFACTNAVTDADILRRDLLLVDIDRVDKTVRPADAVELEAAKSLAQVITAELLQRGYPNPVCVMSGNGYHLYYALLEVENSEKSKSVFRALLKELAVRFDNRVVCVDKTVFNASRITKVPGTIMRKGIESVDRPYRIAEVCDEL